ncbi:copper amine oxidase N-terminal domain-containing protein [Paenibacillus dendritiformis]|uniref:copper amine oxidase N-terminal domain-containing protein n=1 Tax=Paenibacillus dendritiformis TaxID=130049 RepID=UPI00387E1193
MSKRKWEFIPILCLIVVLLTGKITYAAENFFWSDVEPAFSCYTSRDGEAKEMGVVVDGNKVSQDILPCEEAKKNRVIVLVNGKYLHTGAGTGAEPFIEKGRTMIPLRALGDGFGFEAGWEKSEGKITLNKGEQSIVMYIGKSEMLVDGKEVSFEEAAPMVKNGVTFLPVRQLADILGVKVEWDGKTRTATFAEQE